MTYWFKCRCGNHWGRETSGPILPILPVGYRISETCDECGNKNIRPCSTEFDDDESSYGGEGGMFD